VEMSVTGAIKGLFSSGEIIKTATKAADALHYSKEEQGDHQIKKIDAMTAYMSASLPSAISRRIIVAVIVPYWVLIGCLWIGLVLSESAHAPQVFTFLKDIVNPPFMLITGFYFFKHLIGARK